MCLLEFPYMVHATSLMQPVRWTISVRFSVSVINHIGCMYEPCYVVGRSGTEIRKADEDTRHSGDEEGGGYARNNAQLGWGVLYRRTGD